MNFRSKRPKEEPEINFIPLIDLLLVILIFLMITTTYNRLTGMSIQLPSTNQAPVATLEGQDVVLAIEAEGWQINKTHIADATNLYEQLLSQQDKTAWLILYANADIPYQKVIDTMQIAQKAGWTNITLATDVAHE